MMDILDSFFSMSENKKQSNFWRDPKNTKNQIKESTN